MGFRRVLGIFRTGSGDFEINRFLGSVGTITYIIGAHLFLIWNVIVRDRPFDFTEYCLAFPGGLGVAIASIAGAVALKDRNVATSKVIQETGSKPGEPT